MSEAMMEVPRYKSHRVVHALKIVGISLPQNEAGDAELAFEAPFQPKLMEREWLDKHNPEVGGYYIVYPDGYTSFCPARSFEEGYEKIN